MKTILGSHCIVMNFIHLFNKLLDTGEKSEQIPESTQFIEGYLRLFRQLLNLFWFSPYRLVFQTPRCIPQ